MLLRSAVAFWWVGVVGTRLVILVFPGWLPPETLHGPLDPEQEGSFANVVSAVAFLVVALLALGNAVISYRKAAGWIAVGSWVGLVVVAALLAWTEIADVHNILLADAVMMVFGADLAMAPWTKPALLSPLVVAFALAMWVFANKVLPTSAIRNLFALGIVMLLLGVLFDGMSRALLILRRAADLGSMLEESLEFSGALLVGLSAALAFGAARNRGRSSDGIRWRRSVAAAAGIVAVICAIVLAFVFRVPLVDARLPSNINTFAVGLRHQEAMVQELRMPAAPIGRIDLPLHHRDPEGRAGTVGIRFHQADGGTGRTLIQGSVAVPANDRLRWWSIDLEAPLVEAEGQRLTVTVIADVDPGADMLVGVTKGDHYPHGRLWINGAPAWPDQNLNFVAYSAPEPTWSKLLALWQLLISDWRWPALLAVVAVASTLIALTPAVLVANTIARR